MQKINQKNTWELNLIDHLTEIIKVEEEDTETNFQKVGCVLLTDNSLVKAAIILVIIFFFLTNLNKNCFSEKKEALIAYCDDSIS